MQTGVKKTREKKRKKEKERVRTSKKESANASFAENAMLPTGAKTETECKRALQKISVLYAEIAEKHCVICRECEKALCYVQRMRKSTVLYAENAQKHCVI